MRPVTIPQDPPDSYPQATLLGKGIKVTIPSALTGTYQPKTVQDAINILSDLTGQWMVNKWQYIPGTNIKNLNPTDAALNNSLNILYKRLESALKTSKGYGEARGALFSVIGTYCSYCETTLPSRMAVEHMLPKSWFATLWLSWNNFLLACPACNSAKGAKPELKGQAFADMTAAQTGLYGQYAWPNVYGASPPNPPQYPFSLKLCKVVPTKNGMVPDTEITDEQENKLLDFFLEGKAGVVNNCVLFAEEPLSNLEKIKESHVYAALLVTSSFPAFDNVINLVSMNNMDGVKYPDASDSRVADRTMMYFRARGLRRQLEKAVASKITGLPEALLTNVLATATATGHWMAWSYAFRNSGFQGAINGVFPNTASIDWIW